MTRTLAVLLALTLATPALGQAQATSKTPDIVVKGQRPEDKVVCHSQVETGSILAKRVCKTQGEIDEERRKSLVLLENGRRDQETEQHVREIRGGT